MRVVEGTFGEVVDRGIFLFENHLYFKSKNEDGLYIASPIRRRGQRHKPQVLKDDTIVDKVI